MHQRGFFNFATVGAGAAVAVVLGVGIWGTLKGGFLGPNKPVPKTMHVELGKKKFVRLDVHTHISPDGLARAQAIMDEYSLVGMVNLSGMTPGPPRFALEKQIAMARASGGRIAVFANVSFMQALRKAHFGERADYGQALAEELVIAKQVGAIGLKIPKGLGLGYPNVAGTHALAVDDPGLDPLFEKAGELGMPVAIHTGDPKAFWLPVDEKNERREELLAHPEWSFYGSDLPSWDELYRAFERRVGRHPKTIFIGVHFGNNPEDPERVGQMLDKYPNFFIDTAARVPEIGRQNADKMRRFFEKYQDRILFGTDLGVGSSQEDMMYGSNGASPPTLEDEKRFFQSTWRYFETRDKQFESPTPIQGRWKIDGLGLSEPILRKLYLENAVRLLHWQPQSGPVSPNIPAKVPSTTPLK